MTEHDFALAVLTAIRSQLGIHRGEHVSWSAVAEWLGVGRSYISDVLRDRATTSFGQPVRWALTHNEQLPGLPVDITLRGKRLEAEAAYGEWDESDEPTVVDTIAMGDN